jgi:hypothetical protein
MYAGMMAAARATRLRAIEKPAAGCVHRNRHKERSHPDQKMCLGMTSTAVGGFG